MLTGLPEPIPDLDTRPFWDGCRRGSFLLPTCGDCGRPRWPPGPMCPHCGSFHTEWVPATGNGRVHTWVVVDHSADPATAGQLPYAVTLVELAEGVRVVGNCLDCPPEQITAGMPVTLCFETLPGGLRLPNFRREQPATRPGQQHDTIQASAPGA